MFKLSRNKYLFVFEKMSKPFGKMSEQFPKMSKIVRGVDFRDLFDILVNFDQISKFIASLSFDLVRESCPEMIWSPLYDHHPIPTSHHLPQVGLGPGPWGIRKVALLQQCVSKAINFPICVVPHMPHKTIPSRP